MHRYRPPRPRSSPYITKEGYEALTGEEEALWVKRREVTKALAAAAEEGDRSENAEYIYRKRQLRQIDSRIRFLQKRIPDLEMVDGPPDHPDRVYFGARVTLENDEGEAFVYRIVGPDEFDTKPEYISMDSPMAKALLGKSLDAEVVVRTPNGDVRYDIAEIEYP